ncbi:MAG: condensation domain-containing protein [Caldilineaceae bacterium]
MLQTLKLLQRLDTLEIYPYKDGDKLRVNDIHKELTDELRNQLREHKTAILDLLTAKQNICVETLYDLSPMQTGMLFHSQLTPNSGTYIEHTLLHVDDPVFDPARFIAAMQQVINRHDSLRAAFRFEQGQAPVQVIGSQAPLPVTVLEWPSISVEEYSTQLATLVEQDRQTDFDLTQAPLLRLTVVELGPQHDHRYDLLFTFHHILMDRWSVDLFWAAVQRAYVGLPLPQTPPYQAYIHHLRQQPTDSAFWQTYLAGFYAPTPLPGITTTPTQTQGQIASLMQPFSTEESQQLADFARAQGLTMNALFQAAWAVLLARYTNESDLLFGMVTSGRTAPVKGIESILGLFINTLPFRVELGDNPTGMALLQQVAQTQLALQQREHTALLEIQRWSELPAGTTLFETLLLFQNTPQSAGSTPRSAFRHGWVEPGATGYPLIALVTPGSADHPTTLMISYDTARYAADTIGRILTHWQQLVMGIVTQPDLPVHHLPMLTAAEYHQIVHEWNDTAVDFGPPQTIHALFEQQVARTPDAIALVMAEESPSDKWQVASDNPAGSHQPPATSLTYAELNACANQLAHHLIELGVKADHW